MAASWGRIKQSHVMWAKVRDSSREQVFVKKGGRGLVATRLAAISVIGGSVGKLGQFSGLLALAFAIPPASYGTFSALQMTVTAVTSVISGGFAISANRTAVAMRSSYPELSVRGLLWPALGTARFGSGMAAVVGMAVVPVGFVLLGGTASMPLVGVISMGAGAVVFLDSCFGALAGLGAPRLLASAEGVRGFLGGAGIFIGGLLWGPLGAAGLWLGLEFTYAAAIAIMARRGLEPAGVQAGTIKSGRSLVLSGAAGNTFAQVGVWTLGYVISIKGGLDLLGAYALASRLSAFVVMFPGFLSRNFLGELSRRIRARHDDVVGFASRFLIIATGLAMGAGALAIAAGGLFFSDLLRSYEGGEAMLRILVISGVLNAASNSLGVITVAHGRLSSWWRSDFGYCWMVVGATWVGLWSGIPGPSLVWANVLGFTYQVIHRGVVVRRVLRKRA